MHVMVISLAFDKERREKISSIMRGLNIEFSFIDAIYGKSLSENEKKSISTYDVEIRKKRKLGDAELGCTLSHIKAYEFMLRDGLQWACVLEDDAVLDERFGDFILSIKDDELEPNGLYILGGQDGLRYRHKVITNLFKSKVLGGQSFKKISYGHAYVVRACCYLIDTNSASLLINEIRKRFFIIDEWAYLMKRGFFSNMYLADFVHHPVELTNSWIETERLAKKAGKKIDKPKSRKMASRVYWFICRSILCFFWWK